MQFTGDKGVTSQKAISPEAQIAAHLCETQWPRGGLPPEGEVCSQAFQDQRRFNPGLPLVCHMTATGLQDTVG